MLTGQKIAELRTKAGFTQEQLAEKLYVTRAMVSKWEMLQWFLLVRRKHRSHVRRSDVA